MIAWSLFSNPMLLAADGWTLWLVIPLCVSVAIIYKTIRTNHLRGLPLEILALIGYMIVGLIALGVALWAVVSVLS